MLKLGCVISTPDVAVGPLALLTGTFEEKLAKAKMWGYAGVELMVRDAAKLDAQEILSALDRHGLEVPQVVTGELFGTDGLALVHPDRTIAEAAMARAQGVVRLASRLAPGTLVNVGRLRGRLGWFPAEKASDVRARMIGAFRELSDYAACYHVRISLEPCNRYDVDFVNTGRDGLEVAAEVGRENFGLMLDLFHMNIEDRSIEDALREARPLLWHVHIADSNRLAPGQGHLNFSSIIGTLREIGYEGYLSGEMMPLPDPDTAARLTSEYMRQWL